MDYSTFHGQFALDCVNNCAGLIGYAVNEFDSVLARYLADSYLSYAASGFAALPFLRSLM